MVYNIILAVWLAISGSVSMSVYLRGRKRTKFSEWYYIIAVMSYIMCGVNIERIFK